MARSDLLVELVRSGRHSADPRFRSVVEALIAEERAKKHDALASQLSAALETKAQTATSQLRDTGALIGDLLYELQPERGLEELVLPVRIRTELSRIVDEHMRRDLLSSYGLAPRHRLLLVGPPGNGKTTVAQALAHDLMVPLLSVRYEGLIGSFLGETASRLRRVFDYARQRACVLFFDEFDTVGKERGDVHETGEIKRVVSTLLLQMDRIPPHVVVVTATNHPELLDRAVWRRFELRLDLSKPTAAEAAVFMRRLLKSFSLTASVRPAALERQLSGLSYSDIENVFKEVARDAVLQSPGAPVANILRERIMQKRDQSLTRNRRTSRGE